MTKGKKDLLKTCCLALLLMLAIPAVFRIWMAINPPPSRPSPPPAMPLDVATLARTRARALLRTPPARWTDSDRQAEPAIFAWLSAQSKTVLPWEWSEAARTKDAVGYARSWRSLFVMQQKRLSDVRKAIRRDIDRLLSAAEISSALHAHATNQLLRLNTQFATNAYPAAVTVETLSKGRFWGWNRHTSVQTLPDAESARLLRVQLASNVTAQVRRRIDLEGKIAAARREEAQVQELIELVAPALKDGKDNVPPGGDADLDRLAACIRFATGTHEH